MSIYGASVDDNDSQIIYSTNNGLTWASITSDGDWSGTMHSTSLVGASARVRFTGSRVAVICILPTGNGERSMATFSIDNGPPVAISHQTTPPVQFQVEFWNSGPLAMGSHLLVITNAGTENYFRLDRIDYDPTDSNAPNTPPAGTPRPQDPPTTVTRTSSATIVTTVSIDRSATTEIIVSSSTSNNVSSTGSGSTITSTDVSLIPTDRSFSNSTTLLPDQNSDEKSPIAAIVGGVLGGLLFLTILISLLFFIRRRNRLSHLGRWAESNLPPTLGPSGRTVPRPFAPHTDYPGSASSSQLLFPETKQSSNHSFPHAAMSLSPVGSSRSPSDSSSPAALSYADPRVAGQTWFSAGEDHIQFSSKGVQPSVPDMPNTPAPGIYADLVDAPPAYHT
ncbi:hypothetical protein B0H34DRAFT_799352 [Crassisporium funariophilum]|nr:hypothetical protein B0H34DRAFT_799352 [Crassisporium funariophilum]